MSTSARFDSTCANSAEKKWSAEVCASRPFSATCLISSSTAALALLSCRVRLSSSATLESTLSRVPRLAARISPAIPCHRLC